MGFALINNFPLFSVFFHEHEHTTMVNKEHTETTKPQHLKQRKRILSHKQILGMNQKEHTTTNLQQTEKGEYTTIYKMVI